MKKFRVLLLTLLLVSALCLSASAAGFEHAAEQLKSVGLFQGGDNGFELDRAPTRAEAAVMLARLLGIEEAAKEAHAAGTATHPFTDVPAWADPYIGHLYSLGLTSGMTADSYGTDSLCNDKMYCTFVLRALGYSDAAGDFSYDTSVDFAAEKGIYNPSYFAGDFLRDNVAAISYQALFTAEKDKETTLLDRLVADGAVSAEAAAPLQEKADTYAAYLADSAAVSSATSMDLTLTADMTMTIEGAEPIAATIPASTVKVVTTEEKVEMEMLLATETETEEGPVTVTQKMWLKDNVLYVEAEGEKVKTALPEEIVQQLVADQTKTVNLPGEDLCLVETVTLTEEADGKTYTLVMGGALGDAVNSVLAQMNVPGASHVEIGKMETKVRFDAAGVLKNLAVAYEMSMDVTAEGATYPVSCVYNIVCDINAVGDDVVIEFPDFSDFVDAPAE
ncbi:MAG: hypothetical protein IJF59_00975 [Clostridia bacterium]|nr:hypothetical protein [Clostridia bacterium]